MFILFTAIAAAPGVANETTDTTNACLSANKAMVENKTIPFDLSAGCKFPERTKEYWQCMEKMANNKEAFTVAAKFCEKYDK